MVSKRKKAQNKANESTQGSEQTIPDYPDSDHSLTEGSGEPAHMYTSADIRGPTSAPLSSQLCIDLSYVKVSPSTDEQHTNIIQSFSEESWATPRTSPSHSNASVVAESDCTRISSLNIILENSSTIEYALDSLACVLQNDSSATAQGTLSVSEVTVHSSQTLCAEQSIDQVNTSSSCTCYSTDHEVHITIEPEDTRFTRITLERDNDA